MKIFPRDLLRELLYTSSHESLTKISETLFDHSRWSVTYQLIFQEGNKFYRTVYSKGATEYQDERPWDYETDVECVEVQPVEKTVIVYELVPEIKDEEADHDYDEQPWKDIQK